MSLVSLLVGVVFFNGVAWASQPNFTEIRELFKKGRLIRPTGNGTDDLRTTWTWSCSSHYADQQKPGFEADLFNFRTCLENNYCYYNNDAKNLPPWFPAWFGFENNGEFDTTQFLTDQSIASCSGDIRSCALAKGQHHNRIYFRLDGKGDLLLEWTTTGANDLAYDSLVTPTEKVVLYSLCTVK